MIKYVDINTKNQELRILFLDFAQILENFKIKSK
jgi:hypothetical protein